MSFLPLWLNSALVILGLMILPRLISLALKNSSAEYIANTPAFFPRILLRKKD